MSNQTLHKILFENSSKMNSIKNCSVDLIVTSPPYPMIQMWDIVFEKQNKKIKEELKKGKGKNSFELMHKELDKTWKECFRVLKEGGIACINIGDATRSINKEFSLYSNHSRILNYCIKIGFNVLPSIIWRKQTNSPNKFMGSGMLPVGAYITLEHEHILILRKGKRRIFNNDNIKNKRQESSFFWEERNVWFSDIWQDIKGVKQKLSNKKLRERSAAFPINIAYRLINMYSLKGDTVLDPFLGTGTTSLASAISERNSIGVEIDKNFKNNIIEFFNSAKKISTDTINQRLENHNNFILKRKKSNKPIKYLNKNLNLNVMTKNETNIKFNKIDKIENNKNEFIVYYDN